MTMNIIVKITNKYGIIIEMIIIIMVSLIR